MNGFSTLVHLTTLWSNYKISLHLEYPTNECIHIGNNTSLAITHTGSTTLPFSSWSFLLKNVMFPLWKGISHLFFNFVWITMCLSNSYHFLFMWRILVQGQYYCKEQLRMVFMSDCIHHQTWISSLPFSLLKSLSINDITTLNTHPPKFRVI